MVKRARAAAAAGYDGIGADSREVIGTHLPSIAEKLVIPVREVEWYPLMTGDASTRARMFQMADAFGAEIVKTGETDNLGDPGDLTMLQNLRSFADEAADHGLTVAIESVAFGSLWNPLDVIALIDKANRSNVGFLFDTWMVSYAQYRTHELLSAVYAYAPRVVSVEISGFDPGRLTGDARYDSQMTRTLPDARTGSKIDQLTDNGYHGCINVEVASDELRKMPCTDAANATFQAARSLIR
jgi:sugar phosphate isomerase/epimerase